MSLSPATRRRFPASIKLSFQAAAGLLAAYYWLHAGIASSASFTSSQLRWAVYILTAPLIWFLLSRSSFQPPSRSSAFGSSASVPQQISPMDMEKRPNLAEQLERRIKRRISIRTDENESLQRCHQQEASPLFAMLPRELRDIIWQYATAPFEDDTQKFDETAYYYRPGHTACLKTECALLLTCRRAWLEAHAMPMLQAEHSFYYYRSAPDRKEPAWMAQLTDHNRQNIGHLHLFAQMYKIEELGAWPGSLRGFFLTASPIPNDFQPRMLHVTIRHTDWWYWEREEPLRLKIKWVAALLNSPDLRSTETLKLELETLDYKVDQLQPILDQITNLTSEDMATHWIDGKPATTRFVLTAEPEVSTWEGPADIDKEQFRPYAGRTRLKYHVVTLTWKLHFLEHPGGFVPRLRRASRIHVPVNVPSPRASRPTHGRMYMARGAPIRRVPKSFTGNLEQFAIAGLMSSMQWVEWQVHRLARRQTNATESMRREQFEDLMGSYEWDKWRARWEAENSLLQIGGPLVSCPIGSEL